MNDLVLIKGKLESLNFSKQQKVVVKEIKNAKDLKRLKKADFNIIKGSRFNREVLENKKADMLLEPYCYIRRDSLHNRHCGLNQVLCRIASKNKKIIGLSFSEILNRKDKEKIFGRIRQVIKLCRKYKIRMVFSSFAKNNMERRDAKDLLNFAVFLGMTPGEAKKAVSFDVEKYREDRLKEVMPGVKKV